MCVCTSERGDWLCVCMFVCEHVCVCVYVLVYVRVNLSMGAGIACW